MCVGLHRRKCCCLADNCCCLADNCGCHAGVNLSRDGKLCLLALLPARPRAGSAGGVSGAAAWQCLSGYLVDISVLAAEAFTHSG